MWLALHYYLGRRTGPSLPTEGFRATPLLLFLLLLAAGCGVILQQAKKAERIGGTAMRGRLIKRPSLRPPACLAASHRGGE